MLFLDPLADLSSNSFRFKDFLEKKILIGVVYCYACINCNVTYYVKASQHCFTRASEQLGTLNLTRKRIKNAKE